MGLREIRSIRQYIDFDVDGRVRKMYEVTFLTERTEGEFTLDLPAEGYTAEKARELAAARAEEVDKAVA